MLPSSPPPIRAHIEHREANERDAARLLRRPAMTSPILMAGRIAVALLEVEAGFRPGHQLERHCHPTLWERLAPRLYFGGGPAINPRSLGLGASLGREDAGRALPDALPVADLVALVGVAGGWRDNRDPGHVPCLLGSEPAGDSRPAVLASCC